MAPKELTRHQVSSRLAYQEHKPAFLAKLKNRIAGLPDSEEDEEWEDDGSGRPPIPRRPREPIPERPASQKGSDDEDDGDEKPQVVVLKEGKHLSERDVENIRRKVRGLPPLPEETPEVNATPVTQKKEKKKDTASLSFSSSSSSRPVSKRKRVINTTDDDAVGAAESSVAKPAKKKSKKNAKTLLSFGDEP